MAELSGDCFAVGGPLLRVDEALRLLAERITAVTTREERGLAQALGAVLAEDLLANRDVPAADNSAVDGYGVRFDDLAPEGETVLPLAGRAAAGHPLSGPAQAGTAVRIMTGAPLPAGIDTVAMQEDCRLVDGRVALPPDLRRGANCRRAGEDLRAGDLVFQAGRRLRPVDLGLAASLGITRLSVRRPLRVALFSTGDELGEPGSSLPPGAIYDANRFSLAGLLARQGAAVTDLGILPDRRDAIAAALGEAARWHDLLLTSGGVSVGEEDHVKAAVESQGRLHFWRLAIKPGKPLALGQIGRAVFVGLPGNPAAVVVTFTAVVRPLLALLAGAEMKAPLTFAVTSAFAHSKKPERQEWLRVSLKPAPAGGWLAERFAREGSGILSSLAQTDGFAILEESVTAVAPGDALRFLPYSEVAA